MNHFGHGRAVDIVMLGTFGLWTRGTLQSRALPIAQSIIRKYNLKIAIVTTPWDDPAYAGISEQTGGVIVLNTSSVRPWQAPHASWQQARITQDLRPRLVHVFKPKGFGGLATEWLRLTLGPVPVIVDYDDWEGDGGWNDAGIYGLCSRRLFNLQERRLIRNADGVTAASTLLLERAFRMRERSRSPNVEFVPNGLETDWIGRLEGAIPDVRASKPRVLMYSRFAEFSFDWLRQMAHHLDQGVRERTDFELIGTVDEDAIRSIPVNNLSFRLHGYAERDELPELLSRATVALFPYEDNLINRSKQSVKLLELMASGRPTVACDVGDIARIAGDSVYLTESTDPSVFSGAVVDLLNNRHARKALSEAARKRAKQFSIDKLADSVVATYERAGYRLS